MKIIKKLHFSIFTTAQYDNLSESEELVQERKRANISASTSESKVKILPAIPSDSKIMFPGDHTPIGKYSFKTQKYQQKHKEN